MAANSISNSDYTAAYAFYFSHPFLQLSKSSQQATMIEMVPGGERLNQLVLMATTPQLQYTTEKKRLLFWKPGGSMPCHQEKQKERDRKM